MTDFMMIFRNTYSQEVELAPQELQESIKQWQDWMGGIAAQGKFKGTNQLGFQGKTLHADQLITDGPYAEIKEIVGGYVLVQAESLDDAMKLAQGCPILAIGGKVEVRAIMDLTP
jgi:hypothetical protein